MGEARQRRLDAIGAVLRDLRKPIEFGSLTAPPAIATSLDGPYVAIRSSTAVTLPGPDCGV